MLGLVHPCKIYNIFAVGAPVIYIGPEPSHVTEIFAQSAAQYPWVSVRHNESDKLAEQIVQMRNQPMTRPTNSPITARFSKAALIPPLIAGLEKLSPSDDGRPS